MSCMCGDTHCHSCGPAQGNYQCPICGAWADDTCEHIENGEVTPEYTHLLEEIERKRREDEDKLAEWFEEDKRIEAEFKEWRKQNRFS